MLSILLLFAVKNYEDVKEHTVASIGQALLPYVQRCFNSDDEFMPCSVDERFVMINEAVGQRIVKGIQLMYGIEFTWEVVAVDMSCLHLALRIFTARRALAPFSPAAPSSLLPSMSFVDQPHFAVANEKGTLVEASA
ncbi:phosphatidylethanolamine N-methyltransferase [Dissophora globulifera]|nr:phosphatidylethanolamine N-methyltransferase [Dissophora globulifera]